MMLGWTIAVSPGDGLECGGCGWDVPAGYFIAKHPDWRYKDGEWVCLNCCMALVRRVQREQALG